MLHACLCLQEKLSKIKIMKQQLLVIHLNSHGQKNFPIVNQLKVLITGEKSAFYVEWEEKSENKRHRISKKT